MTVADIIIGPARIFYAPLGTALPADWVAYGAAWSAPVGWEEIALTKTPFTMSRDLSTMDVMIERSILPVRRVATEEKVSFETTLAELTTNLLQMAMGGTRTTTAAGAGQVAKEELMSGGQAVLEERTWAVEGVYTNTDGVDFPVRIQIYRATAVLNGELSFGKADSAGIPLKIDALGDLSKAVGEQLFKFQKVTTSINVILLNESGLDLQTENSLQLSMG